MYAPPQFGEERRDVLHDFIQQYPLAAVIAATKSRLEAQHVPLVLDAVSDGRAILQGHVARANPIWQELKDGTEVLVIFHGPNHYVSPSWYPSKEEHGRVVPTWNYIVVHVRGLLTWQHDAGWLRDLLAKTTNVHERERSQPWALGDAPPEYIERLLAGIVGFEIPISTIEGKWKLSQNQGAGDRAGAITGLESELDPQAAEIAKRMRQA